MKEIEKFDVDKWDEAEEQFYEEIDKPTIELYSLDDGQFVACEPFTRYDEPFIKSDYII